MNRLAHAFALALLLPALLVACDDDDPSPGPRDTLVDAPMDGGAPDRAPDTTDAAPPGDAAGDLGDVSSDLAVDAFTPPDANAGELVFVATLSGAEEVPPVQTGATGSATFVLNAARTELRFQLRHNVANVTAGHLHTGGVGENGPIAVGFSPFGPDVSGTLAVTPAIVADLEAGRIYANVHSTTHPGGELRGQLLRPGETVFVATLTGAEESPPVVTAAAGKAGIILNAAKTSVSYRITTSGIMPTAAHFHRGMIKVAGPVVYPLTPLGAAIEGSQAVTATDVAELEAGLWYINFHTAANPGGEIRGQVLAPGVKLFAANLTGAQEVPPVTSAFAGNGMVVLPYTRDRLVYHLTTTATPTAAHFHKAPGGVAGPVVIPISPVSASMSGLTSVTPEQVLDLERGLLYLNVHTAANPGGEVRGQLIAPDETLYTAVLTGAEEVPPVITTATGGLGVILNAAGTQVRYDGSFTGFVATMAHFHAGVAGVAGAVVYPLVFTGTVLSGTQVITPLDLTTINAGGWYVNVHSAANSGGEIRGQLLKK